MKRSQRLFLAMVLWAGASCSAPQETGPLPRSASGDPGPAVEGVSVREESGALLIENDRLFVRYDLDQGLFSAGRLGGPPVLENAFVEARAALSSRAVLTRSTRGYRAEWSAESLRTPLGAGTQVKVALSGLAGLPDVEQRFVVLSGGKGLLLSAAVINRAGRKLRVGMLSPAIADRGGNGGVRIGCGTDTLRILENGFAGLLDFYCRLEPGTMGTLSNWNTAVHDLCSGENFVFGGLTFDRGEPLLVTKPARTEPHSLVFRPLNIFNPPLVLEAGERLDTEVYYLDFCSTSPLAALEDYAEAVGKWQGIRLWTQRHPEAGVPSGWNSWSGSGFSGGYGTGIDQEIIMANLRFMDREFRKWGMTFFQIDDGWQVAEGDWEVRQDRFPDHGDRNGIAWILDRARGRGFRPGLWVSPYNVLSTSRLAAEHPDWLAKKDLVGLLSIDDSMEVLDLTHPEVQGWLAELMSRLKSWGCEWIKLDFGYWFLMTRDWAQPNVTRTEAHRRAQALVRDTLGPEVFFLSVAVMGPNYGLVDSDRIGLDTMPVWEGEKGGEPGLLRQIDNQGVKPSVRTLQRRYYLHNRVWIQHPDLIFFRAHADPRHPPLTLNESRSLCQVVAYAGGIVKLGEKLVEMTPEAVRVTRAVLPVYGACGRPLDLFRREFAEIWSLAVPDFPEPYHTLGLFNWGLNQDLTRNPYLQMPDQDRVLEVSFAEAGLDPDVPCLAYEFWSGRFLGEFAGSIRVRVPARDCLSIALRPRLGRPQFLGANRHVLGGVKVIEEMVWDADAGVLNGVQEGSIGTGHAPFRHHLAFYVPPGFRFQEVRFQAPPGCAVEDPETGVTPAETGSVLDLRFTLRDTDGEQLGESFPRLSWSLSFSR